MRDPTARCALQLQMIAPRSPLSHSTSDLQLPESFISVQSFAPMQAHLDPSPGVSKQLNSALAFQLQASDANVNVTMRRANRIAPPPKQRILVDEASNFMARAKTNIPRPVRQGSKLAPTAVAQRSKCWLVRS